MKIENIERLSNAGQILWVVFKFSAVIATIATAPNAAGIVAKMLIKIENADYDNLKRAFYRLIKNKEIILKGKKDKKYPTLTEKGKKRFYKFRLETLEIRKPKTWDRKYRVLVFDIPEKNRITRDILRSFLKRLDFYRLQKSVWVLPFQCEKEVEFLRELFHIQPYVTLILAKQIENDTKIKNYYNLD